MEQIIKECVEETGREVARNANVRISLEGWPCAATFIGLGIMYVLSVKIKCDANSLPAERERNKVA